MKKILFGVMVMFSLFSGKNNAADAAEAGLVKNVYDFIFKKLESGSEMPLADFSGKVLLIVNTASKCGFTGQYSGLEKLYKQYGEQGLVVIGVPSNDFGSQEPAANDEIAEFCQFNYGVSFPMTEKVSVSGDESHPFYKWAKQELGFGTAPKWNFHKYLVDRNGKLVDHFHSTTTPDSARLVEAIEKLL
jgi:glutathione peroxidase